MQIRWIFNGFGIGTRPNGDGSGCSALRTTRWRFSIGYVSSGSVISNSERRHLECETFPPRENDEFESIKVFCVARDKGPMTSNINNVFPKVIARTKRAALLLSCGTQNKFTLPQPPTKAEAINLHFAVAPLGWCCLNEKLFYYFSCARAFDMERIGEKKVKRGAGNVFAEARFTWLKHHIWNMRL